MCHVYASPVLNMQTANNLPRAGSVGCRLRLLLMMLNS